MEARISGLLENEDIMWTELLVKKNCLVMGTADSDISGNELEISGWLECSAECPKFPKVGDFLDADPRLRISRLEY